jgi:phenylacetic acid degradation operon negative regulatory protein
MFFTLYGVYIRHFADEIWLNSLVQMLAEFDISEQATRAALSRLALQGWVAIRRDGRNSYLKITPRGLERVNEAASRIYRRRPDSWDGCWFLLTYTIPEEKREVRDQLRNDLSWWGFGTLGTSTRVSPHNLSEQMAKLVESSGIAPYVDFFNARYRGPESDRALVEKSWNLATINAAYGHFLEKFKPEYYTARILQENESLFDRDCFVRRSLLVHEYRKFLFIDPALPEELLGEDWRGSEAFELFRHYDNLLAEGAGRYFYSIFESGPHRIEPKEVERGLRAQLDPFSAGKGVQVESLPGE